MRVKDFLRIYSVPFKESDFSNLGDLQLEKALSLMQ